MNRQLRRSVAWCFEQRIPIAFILPPRKRGNGPSDRHRPPVGRSVPPGVAHTIPSSSRGKGRPRGAVRSFWLVAITALLVVNHGLADVAPNPQPGTNDLTVAVAPNVVTNEDATAAAAAPSTLPGFAPAARATTPQDATANRSTTPRPLSTKHSTLSTSSEDIRDIRPPIHIPNHLLWIIYVSSGLAVTGFVLGIWYWLTHRTRRKLLWERALEQLEKARRLMKPEEAYLFSIAVSEIVRIYIEERFQARAAHRTTEEFLHDLLAEDQKQLAGYRPLLADFLEHCDLAKFARWQLSVPEMEAMHQSACTFITQTGKPVDPHARETRNQKSKIENHPASAAA